MRDAGDAVAKAGKRSKVQHYERGHDCMGTPRFLQEMGLWICYTCDWTWVITSDECHLCGLIQGDAPMPIPGDSFISFKDPIHDAIISMHVSCCVQDYINFRLDVSDSDRDQEKV